MTAKKNIVETDELEFETETTENKVITDTQEVKNEIPDFNSPKWTEFILSELDSTELIKGKPKCSGIRRMVEKYVGPIVERKVVQCFPPKDATGIGTIVFGVRVSMMNPKHPSYGVGQLWEEDVADSGPYNTPSPFSKHQCATAATRAEARILRKILRINVIAAEEGADADKLAETDDFEPQDKISEEQINFLDMLCERCNLNVLEFVSSGKDAFKNINDIPHSQAANMLQYLNDIQRNEKTKPKSVGDYKKDWRK